MLILGFEQIHVAKGYSTEQFHFYPRDELTGGSIPSGISVTAFAKIGSYITFLVPEGGLLWNASYDVLYFQFDLGGGHYRQYWLLDGETTGTIYIYAGSYTYGISGSPYVLQLYDLAGVLKDVPFIEVISAPNAYGGSSTGIIERRKVDTKQRIHCEAIYAQSYDIKLKSNTTTYTYGDLLFSNVQIIPLTLKGIDFPQNIILAYQYNRIYAERYNNFSTIKTTYQDTLGYLANVSVLIYFENETLAASSNYTNTAAFIYTWLMAQYNQTYIVRVTIIHSVYGTMNYNTVFYRGGYNVRPWSFPLGSIPNMNTADIMPLFILGGCFLVFSKANAYLSGFLACAVAMFMSVWGWMSIPATAILTAFIVTILVAIAYAKRRVFY
jgi:hypothetical protein